MNDALFEVFALEVLPNIDESITFARLKQKKTHLSVRFFVLAEIGLTVIGFPVSNNFLIPLSHIIKDVLEFGKKIEGVSCRKV